MLNNVLFDLPPRPEAQTPVTPPISRIELYGIELGFMNPSQISKSYQKVFLKESEDKCFELILIAFRQVLVNDFQVLLESDLLYQINLKLGVLLPKLNEDSLGNLDNSILLFLQVNIEKLNLVLDSQDFLNLIDLITRFKIKRSKGLLGSYFKILRFTKWIRNNEKDPYSLSLILEDLIQIDLVYLPDVMKKELARCLTISAILMSTFKDYNIKDLYGLMVSSIARLLKYSPQSFLNSSTVECLQKIRTPEIIAEPLIDVRYHYKYARLDSILQLIRFSNYHHNINDPKILIQLAGISPAMKAEILTHHFNTFKNDEKALNFLYDNISFDSTAQAACFNSFPSTLGDLAILLRANEHENIKIMAFTTYLTNILNTIVKSIKDLKKSSINVKALISSSKVISVLLSHIDRKILGTNNKISKFEVIAPHYMAVACLVADAMIASPIFPFYEVKNPLSFQLKAAFDDMAFSMLSHPRNLLSFYFKTNPTPAKCMIITSGLEMLQSSRNGVVNQKQIYSYIIVNLPKILNYGFSLLKAPTEITAKIVSDYYLKILNCFLFQNIDDENFTILKSILSAPIILINELSLIYDKIEPFNDSNILYSFFGFIENILESPIFKSYILVVCQDEFCKSLFFWIDNFNLIFVSPKIISRIFRIFAKLSHFDNSMNRQLISDDRFIIDCLFHNTLKRLLLFIKKITEIDNLNAIRDKGLLSFSILDFLLSLCYPHELFAIALYSQKILKETIKIINDLSMNSSYQETCNEMNNLIMNEYDKAEGLQINNIIDVQDAINSSPNVYDLLYSIFIQVLNKYRKNRK